MSKNDYELRGPEDVSKNVTFEVGGVNVLCIDSEGIVYKGERVKDAGEAYDALLEVFKAIGLRNDRYSNSN